MGSPVPNRIWLLVVATPLALPIGLGAQIYKWVDASGVTNYSNHRPAGSADGGQVAVVKNRVSVYSPDKGLTQAVDAFRMRSNAMAIERASPPVPVQQYSVPVYVPAPVAYDPCTAYRDAHCNEFYTGYYPNVPGFGRYGQKRWRKKIPQVHIRPGTIAGQVVGANGYIPGNSANARRIGHAPYRRGGRPGLEVPSTGGRPINRLR